MKLQNKITDGRVVSKKHGTEDDGGSGRALVEVAFEPQRMARQQEAKGSAGGHPDTWDHQAVHNRQATGLAAP